MRVQTNILIPLVIAWAFFIADVASGQAFPLRLTVGNESTAIPFTRFFTVPVHPSVQAGTDFTYRNLTHSTLYQTVNLGYIFHNYLYQGLWLNTEAGYDYKFGFGLNLKALLGVGYLHTFTTQQEYQFKEGEYVGGTDWGNPRLMVTLAIGAGFRIQKDKEDSPEVFILYKPWIEYPYSPGFIPVMTHITLEAGFRYPIRLKKECNE
jgi:hypothetical protein